MKPGKERCVCPANSVERKVDEQETKGQKDKILKKSKGPEAGDKVMLTSSGGGGSDGGSDGVC